MHPNPIFRTAPKDLNLAFARDRAFGILSVNGPDGPLLAHVPFLLDEAGASLDLHLVRSNPVQRLLDTPCKAVIAISGPDSYISPDWYDLPDQVPTWNYVAVHLRGTLSRLPEAEMRAMLDRQSHLLEHRLAPKPVWTAAKMTPDVLDRMMRQIVPCRMDIDSVDGTWKLNQNKPDAARKQAARMVQSYGMGSDLEMLAALMLAPPQR